MAQGTGKPQVSHCTSRRVSSLQRDLRHFGFTPLESPTSSLHFRPAASTRYRIKPGFVNPSICSLMTTIAHPTITDLAAVRAHIQRFPCPEGFSPFAWKELKQTAIGVWHAHLNGRRYRGSLHFCRPEFYAMLHQPNGTPIVPQGLMRGYQAA